MAQLIVNPAAGEVRAYKADLVSNESNWTPTRNATSSQGSVTTIGCYVATWSNIQRAFEPFDTSSIPTGANITSATLEFYRDDTIDEGFDNGDTSRVELIQTTQASIDSYANSDWDNITWTSGGSINLASTTNNSYNTITLNATALGWIGKGAGGTTKLALVIGRDFDDASTNNANGVFWQNRGGANPVKLTINYTTSGGRTAAGSRTGVSSRNNSGARASVTSRTLV